MTTTDQGGGRPRLVFSMGGSAPPGAMPREFILREEGTTRIGSAADADLRLDGLAEQHAEIRCHDDEYVLLDLGAPGGSRVDGQPVERAALHTGDRIEFGDWTMSYLRDEHADHGRPFGGRSGGESLRQHPRDDVPEAG
jgi:predicted component of type VI protein secretion system